MRQPEFVHTFGVMGSGKTLQAIQQAMTLERRRVPHVITKSSKDTRGGQNIQTRFGDVSRAIDFITQPDDDFIERAMEELDRKAREMGIGTAARNLAVIIDEVNFMNPDQVAAANELVEASDPDDESRPSISVYTFGIATDFQGKPFAGEQAARRFADRTIELKANCYGWKDDGDCSNEAAFNARLVDGAYTFEGDQVAINQEGEVAPDDTRVTTYQSLCRSCYKLAKLESQHI